MQSNGWLTHITFDQAVRDVLAQHEDAVPMTLVVHDVLQIQAWSIAHVYQPDTIGEIEVYHDQMWVDMSGDGLADFPWRLVAKDGAVVFSSDGTANEYDKRRAALRRKRERALALRGRYWPYFG